jgi:hypothetical protein
MPRVTSTALFNAAYIFIIDEVDANDRESIFTGPEFSESCYSEEEAKLKKN